MSNKKTIFISCSDVDKQRAERLNEYLIQNGYDTWYAPFNINVGAKFYQEIQKAIQDCDAVLLVLSENADKSETVAAELILAHEYHKTIFPLKFDNFIPEKLRYFVATIQNYEWLNINDNKPLEELLHGISRKLDNLLQDNDFAKDNADDNQQNLTYVPKPIDTSDVVLPTELLELTELLAANVHDIWAKGRIEEGWTYGSVKNPALKTTPLLVEYEKLPESEKAFDRNTALETIKVLFKLGRLTLKK